MFGDAITGIKGFFGGQTPPVPSPQQQYEARPRPPLTPPPNAPITHPLFQPAVQQSPDLSARELWWQWKKPRDLESKKKVAGEKPKGHFEDAVEATLVKEGGLRDIPGVELANYGIDARYNPGVNVRELTRDGAKKIYKEKYWDRPRFGSIKNKEIASKVFDTGVNLGAKRSVLFLQRALVNLGANIEVDGDMGPETNRALENYIKAGGKNVILRSLSDQQIQHYHNRFAEGGIQNDFQGLINNRGLYLRPEKL